jgi:mRNA interferase HigB
MGKNRVKSELGNFFFDNFKFNFRIQNLILNLQKKIEGLHMVIIMKSTLTLFGLEHPDVYQPLMDWYNIVKEANWRNFHDIKQTFNSVDSVGNEHYVFNIKGNKYRLIALIFFDKRTVFIRFVGTHSEYDDVNASII